MQDNNKFKIRLRQLRKENNMTQEELADKIGLGRTAITNYETGRNSPDAEMLSIISKLFKTTTDYLLGNSDVRNPYNEDKEKYPKSTDLINFARKVAEENGYDISEKTNEEIAQLILKGLKVEDINK